MAETDTSTSVSRGPIIAIGVAVLIVTATLLFLVRPVRIQGESMIPSLAPGDVVLVWIGPGIPHRATVGSVVIARVPSQNGVGEELVVKRVAAVEMSGDTSRWVIVGDNAGASRDSHNYGPVTAARLVGVVWFRIYRTPGRVPSHAAGSR